MTTKPTVFIHSNDQQIVGALIGAYSMKRTSRTPDAFDVRIIRLEQTPHLLGREGQPYLRKGRRATWHNDDLQSFSPLRRMVPQLMGFEGRAVVTDPDVFALGDIYDLLTMEMNGKAILCRHIRSGYKDRGAPFYASSVMLLDCAKLRHWRWDNDIDEMFAGRLDYGPWIGLTTENPSTIGELGEEWNSFDKLEPQTRLLHMTERSSQPWKTGLAVDFDLNTRASAPSSKGLRGITRTVRGILRGTNGRARHSPAQTHYQPHPDPNQERFFFELLKDALEAGEIGEAFVRARMQANDIRRDAFGVLARLGYRGPPPKAGPGRLVTSYLLQ